MSPSERRPALGARKERRPHPASPAESAARNASRVPAGTDGLGTPKLGDEPVMLCVRVAPSLRRRVKLAAVQCGQPVQAARRRGAGSSVPAHGV